MVLILVHAVEIRQLMSRVVMKFVLYADGKMTLFNRLIQIFLAGQILRV